MICKNNHTAITTTYQLNYPDTTQFTQKQPFHKSNINLSGINQKSMKQRSYNLEIQDNTLKIINCRYETSLLVNKMEKQINKREQVIIKLQQQIGEQKQSIRCYRQTVHQQQLQIRGLKQESQALKRAFYQMYEKNKCLQRNKNDQIMSELYRWPEKCMSNSILTDRIIDEVNSKQLDQSTYI